MITAPEVVPLTEDQTKQLEVFETRLGSIIANIESSTKAFNAERKEVIKAQKEKEYLDQQNDEVLRNLRESEKELVSVNSDLEASKSALELLIKESEALKVSSAKMHKELDERVAEVERKAKDADEREKLTLKEWQCVKSEKEAITNAKNEITKALNTVTW